MDSKHVHQPEPIPNWSKVPDTLGFFWPFHVYLFASLFILLALVSWAALFLTSCRTRRESRYLSTIMLTAVFVLALTRSLILLTDPYLSKQISTSETWTVFWVLVNGVGGACLTASMATLLYVTAVATNVTRHAQVRLGRITVATTICNFAFLVTSDLVVAFAREAQVMLTVCQTTFAVWGIVVSIGFAILVRKMRENAQAGGALASFSPELRGGETERLRRLGLFLGALSVSGGLFFALRIYEALHGIKYEEFSDIWLWWGLKTSQRSLEMVNAVVLLLVFKNWTKGLGLQREHVTMEQVRDHDHDVLETNATAGTSIMPLWTHNLAPKSGSDSNFDFPK